MTRFPWTILLVILCGGALVSEAASKPQRFEYRFRPDDRWSYEIAVDGQVVVATPQGAIPNPVKIRMVLDQTVKRLEGPNAVVEVHVVRAHSTTEGVESPLPEMGQRYTMTLDRHGQILAAEGPDPKPGQEWVQMVFPERELAVGDHWVQETRSAQLGTGVTRTKYTLAGFETVGRRECGVFNSELAVEPGGGNPLGTDAFTSGRTWFDVANGRLVRTTATTRFSFRMPMPDDPTNALVTTTTLKIDMRLR